MGFEKVSLETWKAFNPKNFNGLADKVPTLNENNYNRIIKPKRSTKYSAGYDFHLPFDIDLKAGEKIIIPTGIKANLFMVKTASRASRPANGIIKPIFTKLALYPRSSLGFKYGFTLLNTIAVIDMDYYDNSDNEGHIFVPFTVTSDLKLPVGSRFCQGVIEPFCIMDNDTCDGEERSGGFGSTGVEVKE